MNSLTVYRRQLNLLAFAATVALLGLAYYLQYLQGMDPCPLCMLQRLALAAVGIVFLLAAMHNPAGWGARVYGVGVLVTAASGSAIAGRHLWLQSLPPEQVPACGPGLAYMMDVFPPMEVLQRVLAGSGECAEVETVLGVTIPAWTLAAFLGFALVGLLANWRRRA